MLKGPLTASYATYVPTFPPQHKTHAQRAGLNFEAATKKKLQLLYPDHKQEHGPWLYYKSSTKSGVCQPDSLLWLAPDHLLIIEVKLTHKVAARQKLTQFYGPILQAIYPDATISYLQIYKTATKACHKHKLTIYNLTDIAKGKYKECQFLGL